MEEGQQARQTELMEGKPAPGTIVYVDVYADTAPNGSVEWSHQWNFRNYSPKTGRIEIPRKGKGEPATPIQFEIHDRTEPRVGLRFVDGKDAIWVSRIACPRSTASDPEITGIAPSGTELKVVDLNQDECILHYNLRFQPDPARYYYDPEIRNGGSD